MNQNAQLIRRHLQTIIVFNSYYLRRNTSYDCIIWNILGYDGISANSNIITNSDAPKILAPRPK